LSVPVEGMHLMIISKNCAATRRLLRSFFFITARFLRIFRGLIFSHNCTEPHTLPVL
jgi:hypothetical protein